MRTLKGVITQVVYDRKTGKRELKTISPQEHADIEQYRKEHSSPTVYKEKKARKGGMNGNWMKNVYGR